MLSFFTAFFAVGLGIAAVSFGDIMFDASETTQLVVATTLIFGIASAIAALLYGRSLR